MGGEFEIGWVGDDREVGKKYLRNNDVRRSEDKSLYLQKKKWLQQGWLSILKIPDIPEEETSIPMFFQEVAEHISSLRILVSQTIQIRLAPLAKLLDKYDRVTARPAFLSLSTFLRTIVMSQNTVPRFDIRIDYF